MSPEVLDSAELASRVLGSNLQGSEKGSETNQ